MSYEDSHPEQHYGSNVNSQGTTNSSGADSNSRAGNQGNFGSAGTVQERLNKNGGVISGSNFKTHVAKIAADLMHKLAPWHHQNIVRPGELPRVRPNVNNFPSGRTGPSFSRGAIQPPHMGYAPDRRIVDEIPPEIVPGYHPPTPQGGQDRFPGPHGFIGTNGNFVTGGPGANSFTIKK
jgi:hypothetical protein